MLMQNAVEEVEGSDGLEGRGVGTLWSAVVGMHTTSDLEMEDHLFDDVPYLVDRRVELFLPVKEFTTGGFAIRGRNFGSQITSITEGVFLAEHFAQARVVHGFGVVSLARQRVGDMQQISGEITDELVSMAGGLVLAGVQLGCIGPGPAGTQRPVDHGDTTRQLLG
jgi:hypothetical protein